MRHIIPHPMIFAMSLWLAFISQNLFAIGLGDISVKSFINDPLHAEIKLHSIPASDKNNLVINLASAQAFERANLKRPYLLSQLKFTINYPFADKSQALLSITTEQPIKEPILNFLIELTWPNGKVLREYAILLDHPKVMVATKPKVNPVATTKPVVENQKPLLSTKKDVDTVYSNQKPVAAPPQHTTPITKKYDLQPVAPSNASVNALDFFGSAETVVMSGESTEVTTLVPTTEITTRNSVIAIESTRSSQPVAKQAAKPVTKKVEVAAQPKATDTEKANEAAVAKRQELLAKLDAQLAQKKAEIEAQKATPAEKPEQANTAKTVEEKTIEEKTVSEPDHKTAVAPVIASDSRVEPVVTTETLPVSEETKPEEAAVSEQDNAATTATDNNDTETTATIPDIDIVAETTPVVETTDKPVDNEVDSTATTTEPTDNTTSNTDTAETAEPNIDALLEEHGLGEEKTAVTEEATQNPEMSQPETANPVETTPTVSTETDNATQEAAPETRAEWDNSETGFWMGLGAISILLLVGVGGFILNRRNLKNQSQQEFEHLYNTEHETGVEAAENNPADAISTTVATESSNLPDEEELIGVLEDVDVYLSYERYHEAKSLINAAIDEYPQEYEFHLKRLEVDAATYDFETLAEHGKVLYQGVNGKGEVWNQALALINGLEQQEADKVMAFITSKTAENHAGVQHTAEPTTISEDDYLTLGKEAGLAAEDLMELKNTEPEKANDTVEVLNIETQTPEPSALVDDAPAETQHESSQPKDSLNEEMAFESDLFNLNIEPDNQEAVEEKPAVVSKAPSLTTTDDDAPSTLESELFNLQPTDEPKTSVTTEVENVSETNDLSLDAELLDLAAQEEQKTAAPEINAVDNDTDLMFEFNNETEQAQAKTAVDNALPTSDDFMKTNEFYLDFEPSQEDSDKSRGLNNALGLDDSLLQANTTQTSVKDKEKPVDDDMREFYLDLDEDKKA